MKAAGARGATWAKKQYTTHADKSALRAPDLVRRDLTVQARHDPNWYPTGVRISDRQIAALPLHPHDWHGEWNYTINTQSDLA